MSQFQNVRVVFLQNNAINESLGLCDLAGHLKQQGVTTRLFLELEEKNLPEKLRRFDPHMTVIPCDLLGHNTALRLAQTAKTATGSTVVLGGVHPTFFPNVVLKPGVDYAFAGEAEGPVTDLLAAVLDHKDPTSIPNLIYRRDGQIHQNPLRPLIEDMNKSALPDRDIYYRYDFIAKFPWKKFGTGRGCMNSCGYCFNPAYRAMIGGSGNFYRRKGHERIAQEINDVKRRYPLKVLHFSDDLFNSGVDWLEGFIERYRKDVSIPFSANTYAKSINEKSIALLKKGGCRVLAIGLEVADDEMRLKLMNKGVTAQEIVEAARLIKQAGIHLVTFNILGLPWATVDDGIQTLALNQKMRSDHTRVSVLTPFPKSRLTRMMIDEGYLAKDFEDRIYEVDDLPHWPAESLFKRMDRERTMRLFRLWQLLLALRIPSRWVKRLVNSRLGQLLAPLSLLIALRNEKKIFGLSLLPGFRYFLHVKSPGYKTSNYVSFI